MADQPSGIFLGRHDGGTRQQGKGFSEEGGVEVYRE